MLKEAVKQRTAIEKKNCGQHKAKVVIISRDDLCITKW